MPDKTLHTNRRPALGFGLSSGLFDAGRPDHVIVQAAVGELGLDCRAPMQQWLINVWRILSGWLQAALNNAEAVRQSRMLPAWLAATGVSIDFVLMGLWFRYTDQSWGGRWVVASALMFLVRLVTVTVILVWACRHYRISAAALGVRPSTMFSDFRWSFRICALGALVIAAAFVTVFVAALGLGIRLPAPPELSVQFLAGNWSIRSSILMVGLGVTGNMLVVVGAPASVPPLTRPPPPRTLPLGFHRRELSPGELLNRDCVGTPTGL